MKCYNVERSATEILAANDVRNINPPPHFDLALATSTKTKSDVDFRYQLFWCGRISRSQIYSVSKWLFKFVKHTLSIISV